MPNVLLSSVGRRHYLAQYFSEALTGRGKLVGIDMDPAAPALQACAAHYVVPAVSEENYLERLLTIIKRERIDMIFTLNDLETGLLVQHRQWLEAETGAVVYVPDSHGLQICEDKWRTFRFVAGLGLPAIPTFLDLAAVHRALLRGEITFPLIVKPRWGSGSIALFRVISEAELEPAYAACQAALERSILAPFGTDDAVLIQAMIEGTEFGADMLYAKDERFLGFSVRRKLAMRAGETDKAMSVGPEEFATTVQTIAAHLTHRGNMDCDFLVRDGRQYLLELNPRFGGGYPFTHLAGANHVKSLLDDFDGLESGDYSYAHGLAFSKCDTLVSVPAPAPS